MRWKFRVKFIVKEGLLKISLLFLIDEEIGYT